MTESASWEVQKAIVTRLLSNSDVAALVGDRVVDYATEDLTYPFVEYKENSSQEWDTDTDLGVEHTVTLHAWSRAEGSKEAMQILQAVKDSLQDHVTLALTDHNLVNMRFTFSDLVRDPDGQTYHAIAQYRVITEEG